MISSYQTGDPYVFVYRFVVDDRPVWIAWYEPPGLPLLGDEVPAKSAQFSAGVSSVKVEPMTSTTATTATSMGGKLTVALDATPVFIFPTG